jgi:hypothetical protein
MNSKSEILEFERTKFDEITSFGAFSDDQNSCNEDIIDIHLEQEVKMETEDLCKKELDPDKIISEPLYSIGQKRKNTENTNHKTINQKEYKEEFVEIEELENEKEAENKIFEFNPIYKNLVAGTDGYPFLFHISRGGREGTLVFHVKIGIYFYELRLDRVFQTSCLFKCKNLSCKARAKMQLLAPELISSKVQTRKTGSRKNLYFVNRQDPKLLDVNNWKGQFFKSLQMAIEKFQNRYVGFFYHRP